MSVIFIYITVLNDKSPIFLKYFFNNLNVGIITVNIVFEAAISSLNYKTNWFSLCLSYLNMSNSVPINSCLN